MENEELMSNSEQFKEMVVRFENTIKKNEQCFFDVSDFDDLIDYYFDRNNFSGASRVVEMATIQHPQSTVLMLRKAQLLASTNRPQKALEILSRLEIIEPSNIDIYYTKGNIYSQLRQYNKALETFKKAAEYAEDDRIDDVYLNIAFEYTNLKNYSEAIIYLKKALLENPENESALFELAFCYEITENTDESIKYYSEFIDKYPYSAAAWFNLGVSYSKMGMYEKAIDAYDYSIAIDENFSSAYFNKANALAELGQYKEAIITYKEVFNYEEHDALTYYYIGECYEQLENYEKAMIYFVKAAKQEPKLADAWVGIGMILDIQNKPIEGIHYIKKGIDLDAGNADYYYILADVQRKNGFTDEAEINYNKVLELNPENEEIYLDFSALYYEQGEIETALEIICEGIEKQSKNALNIYRIVFYLIENGNEKEAYSLFEMGLNMDFEKHTSLFEFVPELKNNDRLIELIEMYKK